MRRDLTIDKNSSTPHATMGQGSTLSPSMPAQRLEQARARVKTALHAAEDGEMDAATFDDIARPLVLALRELDELSFNCDVMSRAREVRAL